MNVEDYSPPQTITTVNSAVRRIIRITIVLSRIENYFITQYYKSPCYCILFSILR